MINIDNDLLKLNFIKKDETEISIMLKSIYFTIKSNKYYELVEYIGYHNTSSYVLYIYDIINESYLVNNIIYLSTERQTRIDFLKKLLLKEVRKDKIEKLI